MCFLEVIIFIFIFVIYSLTFFVACTLFLNLNSAISLRLLIRATQNCNSRRCHHYLAQNICKCLSSMYTSARHTHIYIYVCLRVCAVLFNLFPRLQDFAITSQCIRCRDRSRGFKNNNYNNVKARNDNT